IGPGRWYRCGRTIEMRVSPMRYPRDMIGYGPNTPRADWPGGARIAVQFVLNYEEGGENSVLHGDAASEAFLADVIGAAPWPGQPSALERPVGGRRRPPGRLPAAPPSVHRTRPAGDRLRGGNGADARARAARRHAGRRLGDRQPWLQVGRAQGHGRRDRARPD